MSLSWYIIVYHLQYHDISCPSSTHDISRYHLFFFSMWYHVISCRVFDDTWTWYRHMIYWWYMMIYRQIQISYSTSSTLHDIEWYHMISSPPTTAQAPRPQTVISRYIMWYHETWYHMIHHDTRTQAHRHEPMISNDIWWYSMIYGDDLAAWLLRSLLWQARDIRLFLLAPPALGQLSGARGASRIHRLGAFAIHAKVAIFLIVEDLL